MGVGQVIHSREQGAESPPVVGDAAHRHAAKAHAMVAAFPTDEARPLPVAPGAVIGERDLKCRVHGLRSRIDEEDAVEAFWRHFG